VEAADRTLAGLGASSPANCVGACPSKPSVRYYGVRTDRLSRVEHQLFSLPPVTFNGDGDEMQIADAGWLN
jgi:hypothetical protein